MTPSELIGRIEELLNEAKAAASERGREIEILKGLKGRLGEECQALAGSYAKADSEPLRKELAARVDALKNVEAELSNHLIACESQRHGTVATQFRQATKNPDPAPGTSEPWWPTLSSIGLVVGGVVACFSLYTCKPAVKSTDLMTFEEWSARAGKIAWVGKQFAPQATPAPTPTPGSPAPQKKRRINGNFSGTIEEEP